MEYFAVANECQEISWPFAVFLSVCVLGVVWAFVAFIKN